MFEKEYREVFSQVKASECLTRRIVHMKKEHKVLRFARPVRLVFIAALLCTMLALTAFAYSGFVLYENPGDMLEAFFGENGYAHVDSEIIEEDRGEDGTAQWQTPEQDRESLNETLADELVAPYISAVGQTICYEGYTLTLEAYSYDSDTNTALVYYFIENPDGVSGYELLRNGEVWWPGGELVYCNQSMKSYIVPDKTTDTKLYGAGYISIVESRREEGLYLNFAGNLNWDLFGNRIASRAGIELPLHGDEGDMKNITLADGNIVLSPISIVVFGEDLNLMNEGWETKVDSLVIRYSDGREYLIQAEGVMNYAYGTMEQRPGGYATYCLNRIVALDEVTAVVVNGTEYTR